MKSPAAGRGAWRLGERAERGVLLLPFVAGALVLVIIPALLTLALAFMYFDGVSPLQWWGLRNFQMFYRDPLERIAIFNSLFFTALAVPMRVLGALGLALLLRRPQRGAGLYRAAVFLPSVVPDVAYALIWLWVFNPLYGPVNLALRAVGLPAPGWLANPDSAKLVFVFMALFQVGEGFVVLLAGLQSVPDDLYDAAVVDGAGPRQLFARVTLPLLMPWLALLAMRDLILSFVYPFVPSLLMTGGDPYYSTLFLPLLAFREAFGSLRFGMGAAITLVTFAVSVAALMVAWLVVRRWGILNED
ncbi:MAG: sugar ABC transporter permease [Anaerolineales bacterium]